jgi:hypothetical protein
VPFSTFSGQGSASRLSAATTSAASDDATLSAARSLGSLSELRRSFASSRVRRLVRIQLAPHASGGFLNQSRGSTVVVADPAFPVPYTPAQAGDERRGAPQLL